MGDIADMMLNGDLCENCGEVLGGDSFGLPRYCSEKCAKGRGFDGIAKNGSGFYRKKGRKQPNCFSIKMTFNGQKMFDDKKDLIFKSISHEKAQELANKIRKVVEEFEEGAKL